MAARTAARPHVDEVALIITTDGCWMPTAPAANDPKCPGIPVRPPVTSVGQLARILTEATDAGRLQSVGVVAQVWVLGEAADALGWVPEPVQKVKGMTDIQVRDETRRRIADKVAGSAAELERFGWRLREGWREGGARVRLERIPDPRKGKTGARSVRVDVVLEVLAWTTGGATADGNAREKLGVLGSPAAGTGLPDSDADPEAARLELARRLAWCVEVLGMLPSVTGAATGAALVDRGWKAGAKINESNAAKRGGAAARGVQFKGRDVVIPSGPGPIPPFTLCPPVGDIEPRLSWWRLPSVAEIETAAALVVPDRRGSYLGSAGASLVLGKSMPLEGDRLDSVLWFSDERNPNKWPRGLWLLGLPHPDLVPDWDVLPPLHDSWWRAFGTPFNAPAPDAAAGVMPVWVTTETAAALAADPTLGGYGLDWCRNHVSVLEAWVWERSGTALKPWQMLMSRAYKTAVAENDRVMKAFVGDIYKSYIGRLHKSPEDWGPWRRRHSQPVWRAQIQALTTVSIRRKTVEARARIRAATGRECSPFAATTDDTTWLLPAGVDPALVSDDTDGNLGRMVLKAVTPLSDTDRAALITARETTLAEGRLSAFTTEVMRLRKTGATAADDDMTDMEVS
ncbi:hypothetical protein [Nocardia paucivorans]|uniref:hypothetical protein n=1 Tax=Nocardia paucivorans TaxID=114259 RepID=UPI0002DB2010|nr:hypothetical protein [Nocardia paucivorans]